MQGQARHILKFSVLVPYSSKWESDLAFQIGHFISFLHILACHVMVDMVAASAHASSIVCVPCSSCSREQIHITTQVRV